MPTTRSIEELEAWLDGALNAVLTSSQAARRLANALARCPPDQQDFALYWVDVIAKTNAELAYQFADYAPMAMRSMGLAHAEAWIIRAMDIYDRKGLYPACAVLKDVDAFAAQQRESAYAVRFEEVAKILALFVHGLAGRALKVDVSDIPFTDTAVLFLPPRLARFQNRELNFRLYKAMAAHQWAQGRYGTFRESLVRACQRFRHPDKAVQIFHALETIRLDARIAADLAGLARDMSELRQCAGDAAYPASWAPYIERLQRPHASVHDSHALLPEAYGLPLPLPCCYQGTLSPERAEATMVQRIAREKEQLRDALAHRLADKDQAKAARFTVAPTRRGEPALELRLDGAPVALPADVKAVMASIVQDLGAIPDDYLVAAHGGGHEDRRPEDTGQTQGREEGTFVYNEWDYRRRHYRKQWCVLREHDVCPANEPFVEQTLLKYAGLVAGLRKTFEALRGENKREKKQPHGDEVDFDAVVEAHADLRCGREMTERVFVKANRIERDIAVMFMVDMSGSTKGWINDAERESLVLLCEALEVLGDRYAIYGFSGMTRKRCELLRVKRFDEPYSDLVKKRITGITPHDYTRMGVTIRHLTTLLKTIEARTKLLITLSDGKPDDYDGYRGDYGIEDTRQALFEARQGGVHPFCITIDTEAHDYLPHMYGAANYTLIDDVRKLPVKVSDIYRKLTT